MDSNLKQQILKAGFGLLDAIYANKDAWRDMDIYVKFRSMESVLRQLEGAKKAFFYGDWTVTEESQKPDYLFGYTYGTTWNGWAMPMFPKETVEKIVKQQQAIAKKYPDTAFVFSWEEDTVVSFNPAYADIPEEATIRYEPHTITVDGQEVKVWDIGSGDWCWCEEERERLTPRQLKILGPEPERYHGERPEPEQPS